MNLNSRQSETHPRILVVDDSQANLQLMAAMLKVGGYQAQMADNGKAALEMAAKDPPDLILLDVSMPEMHGYEVCERLKIDDRLKGIPVIFVSALAEPLDKVRAFATGGVDYLTKPCQLQELHARVATHLKIHRLQVELEAYSHQLQLANDRLRLDLDLAREVQNGLLPRQFPEIPGYEFFAHYQSASQVGGDYYDFIRLPHDRVAVVVGDVAGKGVAAALLMAKLSADTRFCVMAERDPAAAFNKLNRLTAESGVAGGRLVTMVCAILDPVQNTMTLANAGHPPPLLYDRAARTLREIECQNFSAGVPIGVVENFEYSSCPISLHPGDCVVAFTDGITEALNQEDAPFGTQGITTAIPWGDYSPQALGERVVRAVKEFTGNRAQHDDITLVGFGRLGS